MSCEYNMHARHGLCCNTVNPRRESYLLLSSASHVFNLLEYLLTAVLTGLEMNLQGRDTIQTIAVSESVVNNYIKFIPATAKDRGITSRVVTPMIFRLFLYITKHFSKHSDDCRRTHESFRR